MASYIKRFKGDFDDFTNYLESSVKWGSNTCSVEEKYKTTMGNVRCCVVVFERYSFTGKNRVSMNVTILGCEDDIEVIGVASGGSQGAFMKINTWGESSFLDTLRESVGNYIYRQKQPAKKGEK